MKIQIRHVNMLFVTIVLVGLWMPQVFQIDTSVFFNVNGSLENCSCATFEFDFLDLGLLPASAINENPFDNNKKRLSK